MKTDDLSHIDFRHGPPPQKEPTMTPEQFAELKEILEPVRRLAEMQIAMIEEEMRRRSADAAKAEEAKKSDKKKGGD